MVSKISELVPEQLRCICNPDQFEFDNLEEVPPLEEMIGQERAVGAIEFGVGIKSDGFNIYALGPVGVGRTSAVRNFLEPRAKAMPIPDDWCYIHNFSEPHKPKALRLSPGKAKEFKTDMEGLVNELRREIPRVLESDAYENERNQVLQDLQDKRSTLFVELDEKTRKRGFALQQNPSGIFVLPIVDGQVLTSEQYVHLSQEVRQRIEEDGQSLQRDLNQTMRSVRELERQTRKNLENLERQAVVFAVGHLIEELKEKFSDSPDIVNYLDDIQEDVITHVQDFMTSPETQLQVGFPNIRQRVSLERYQVNVVVDNSATTGAPVVEESNPTYANLIGRIERRAEFGTLITDFTMIKPAALHRANGGYLIVESLPILRNPFAWNALKRSLKNREVKVSDIGEEFSYISTVTLEPEPIPLNVKVILIGDPHLYYLLYSYDEDFRELFKIKADFNTYIDRTEDNMRKYAQFISGRCKEEGLRHFDKSGIARIIEYSAELTGDQTKLSTRFADICDIIKEAIFWAERNNRDLVAKEDVQKAIDAKIYRANRIEEQIQKMIEDGTIFIDTEGEVVGQVNGLSVMSLGDYTFGKPSRITARTYMGSAGVINIEREVKMSGPIHNKGVMILSGYLNGKYGQNRPVSMSASIGFEQLYEGVEGDSASSTELYALLSSLSASPIKQGIAVTGSVNQRGDIQPIGGVTEKIGGFFDVCKAKGLTGEQGVIIPSSNVKNLMLREEIVETVRQGKFHIYPVNTIDEGIEILTGREAGELQADGTYPEGTVNWAMEKRLRELSEKWKEYQKKEPEASQKRKKEVKEEEKEQ